MSFGLNNNVYERKPLVTNAVSLPSLECQIPLFGVTDDMFQIVLDHYEVSDRMLDDSVKLYQEWFAMQPHFPKIKLEDRSAKRIISLTKFSVEKAKEKLESWLTARSIMPEFFSHRDPWSPDISRALESIDWFCIPKHAPGHQRVQFLRINSVNFADYDPVAAFGICFMIADIRYHLDVVLGDIFVCDMSHLTFAQAVKVSPATMKKVMFVTQKCYGSNIKGMHIVNLPPYAEFLVNLTKACMKKKVADRVFVHKSLEDLHKVLPKDVIPKDMGGDYPRNSNDLAEDMRKAIRSPEWRSWFLDYENQRTDESKRSKQSETAMDDLLGMMGSFRKLDID